MASASPTRCAAIQNTRRRSSSSPDIWPGTSMTSAAKSRHLAFTIIARSSSSARSNAQTRSRNWPRLTDLPVEALKRTFEDVRRYAAGEKPDPLGRDFTKQPPLAAPYLAAKINGALFHTQGGSGHRHAGACAARSTERPCRTSLPEAARRVASRARRPGVTCPATAFCRRRSSDASPAFRRRGFLAAYS